jgi:hypothetical protein
MINVYLTTKHYRMLMGLPGTAQTVSDVKIAKPDNPIS